MDLIVMTAKTNAVRLLERLAVPFELREYEVDPNDLAAETVARKVGMPPEVDETAQLFDVISISAGVRGLQILLTPGDYIRVTEAKIAPIAKDKDMG
jgi:Cys-tRNA(Pro)/Cys-tRNA(Cys) deacylase